jgi:hypothetical protein
MDIEIIADPGSGKDFSAVQKGDVVILPAFGASVQEMQLLNDKEAIMVDTTCPWVSKVITSLGVTLCVIGVHGCCTTLCFMVNMQIQDPSRCACQAQAAAGPQWRK